MELPNDIDSLKDLISALLDRVTALTTDVSVLSTHIEDLRSENSALKSENADLRSRLELNSHNSHKPPSSDGLTKKPAFSASKGKNSGGQLGHTGTTLKMSSNPDHILVYHPPFCTCCSRVFTECDVERIILRRQVFDLPTPRLVVTEHQLGVITCCGRAQEGILPTEVTSVVQYGSKIKALSVLLSTDYKMPFKKIEQLFTDLFACPFNESTAISANIACFDALAPIESYIKDRILAQPIAHFDETGMRVEGKLHWFHTASTQLFTYLFVHPKRGKQALTAAESLIKDFTHRAIHDCWMSYFDFTKCQHALCNAHIVRELEALKEQNSKWAQKMQDLLFELFEKSLNATSIVPLTDNEPDKAYWLNKYDQICQQADIEEPPPIKPIKKQRGKFKNSKGRNLLNRLVKYREEVLAFAFVKEVPFTNNRAERDIRCLKTKQKVAMSFRTQNGAKYYARIQGFVTSVRKHKINVLEQLENVFFKKQPINIFG